ncbi:MAG: thiamine-phosphate kinase [Candidatus Acidiferrales bacterium]
MRSEAEIVRFLQKKFRSGGGLRVGIGDDAAVVRVGPREWVITTDLLVEGAHFLPGTLARAVGWKALARSLSDCAAMGARPRYTLVALALPPATPDRWVREFFSGFARLARRHGVRLAGGDLSRAGQIVADVQVIGEVARGRTMLRRGARPGDVIFVSGRLGLAGLGLACRRKKLKPAGPLARQCRRAHLYPQPRVGLGPALARRGATAMIDVSDGLSTDLHHLCEASGVGARVFASKIPAVEMPVGLARRLRTSGLDLALNSGEDYELLFMLPQARAARLPKKLAGVALTAIGEITRGPQITIVEARGREHELVARGWDHFRKRG